MIIHDAQPSEPGKRDGRANPHGWRARRTQHANAARAGFAIYRSISCYIVASYTHASLPPDGQSNRQATECKSRPNLSQPPPTRPQVPVLCHLLPIVPALPQARSRPTVRVSCWCSCPRGSPIPARSACSGALCMSSARLPPFRLEFALRSGWEASSPCPPPPGPGRVASGRGTALLIPSGGLRKDARPGTDLTASRPT